MPDNGAGTYTLPQPPFVSNTTISTTAVNSDFSDLATALNNRLTRTGENSPSANLPMAGYRHTGVGDATARTQYASAAQVQDGALVWGGTSTGSANAHAITPSPGISAYAAGQRFAFIAGYTSTGTPTLAVSGLTAQTVLGDLVANEVAEVVYNGTDFHLVSDTPTGENFIINGGFAVNQRAYATGTATAAGVYMHDRWKAGALGCTYSFAQSAGPSTTITITAGTLVQVIEGAHLEGGTFTLAWAGTSLARVGGGSYAASPIVATGLTAGDGVTVEFATGTLGAVRFNKGSIAMPFKPRNAGQEVALCQRYYFKTTSALVVQGSATGAGSAIYQTIWFPSVMRAAPTATTTFSSGSNNAAQGIPSAGTQNAQIRLSAIAAGDFFVTYDAGNAFSAEL